MSECVNAKIQSAFLGREDHGIPTFNLDLRFDSSGQGFGGYDLRHSAYGIPLLMEILDVVGVEQWSNLAGSLIRIERDGDVITRIGHIVEDKWLEVKAFASKDA